MAWGLALVWFGLWFFNRDMFSQMSAMIELPAGQIPTKFWLMWAFMAISTCGYVLLYAIGLLQEQLEANKAPNYPEDYV